MRAMGIVDRRTLIAWANGDGRTSHGSAWHRRHLLSRARSQALATWYRAQLGVGAKCNAEAAGEPSRWFWNVEGGPVVFQPLKADTDYFPADKAYMLNLRVDDLDGMLEQLNARVIAIETRDAWDAPETGRFARINDSEGNAIELWEMTPG